MKSFSKFDHIYLYRDSLDFRKGIYGLVGVVQEELELSPFDNYLFIFINRSKDRVKILYWDQTGFALWYKVLEKYKYSWPKDLDSKSLIISTKDLQHFLKGLNPWQTPHREVLYEIA